MPGPAPRPKERRRADAARQLRPAVVELLRSGARYRELSVERIAATAGMARSTFYVYFSDRGDLLQTLGRDAISEIIEAGLPWLTVGSDASPARLRAILADVVGTYRRHGELMVAMTEESAQDERVRTEFRRLHDTGLRTLAAAVERGQGEADTGLDAEMTARWLMAMLERGLYLLAAVTSEETVERAVDTLTTLVWNMLYMPATVVSGTASSARP